MQTLYEVARLAALPATTSVKTGLWALSCGLEVFVAPAAKSAYEAKKLHDRGHPKLLQVGCQPAEATSDVVATIEESGGLGTWFSALWALPKKGYSSLRRICSITLRILLLLLLSCVLYYTVPVCGSSLRTPLYLLPMQLGAEAVAEVHLRSWAAALPAGSTVVDADLEMMVPNLEFNTNRFMELLRVDLELGQTQVSRPLVLPYLSPTVQAIRELVWALPVAFGLCDDERVIQLSLATGIAIDDLVNSETVKLRLTPSLMVRTAQIRLTPRFAGPLGRPLNSFVFFVPICTVLLYLGLFRSNREQKQSAAQEQKQSAVATSWMLGDAISSRRSSDANDAISSRRSSEANAVQLHFIEVQMLAKALSGTSVVSMFSATLAAFEAEDRASHGDILEGKIKLDRLPIILEASMPEWKVNFDEWQIRNLIGTTFILPPTSKGLITQDGHLRYRLWLAVATVTQLYGDGKLIDYAAWVEHHECSTKEPVTGN